MTINLQVGGVYATAEGIKHWITHLGGSGLFVTKHGKFYREDGQHSASIKSHYDLITVISEPDAPTEAPAPDGVAVTTKVTQIEICAPETETISAVTYSLVINDDGVLNVTDGCGYGVSMSPAAARAIGAELIRMGGE
jgi:hypothetical protein